MGGTVGGGAPHSPSYEAGLLEETDASELNVPLLCPSCAPQQVPCPLCASLCHWEHGDGIVYTCSVSARKKLMAPSQCLVYAWEFRANVSFTLDVTGS